MATSLSPRLLLIENSRASILQKFMHENNVSKMGADILFPPQGGRELFAAPANENLPYEISTI